MKENGLIFFLKLPSKGKVKTRIEKDLGPDLVFTLYNAFITDILSVCESADADIIIAYSPDADAEKKFELLLKKHRSFRQRGDDLGQRMYNAFTDAYSYGYKSCILIGSDIPELKIEILNKALAELEEFDIVLGPSADGGYYLIGNKNYSNSVLYYKNIEWSRPDVYYKTKVLIESLGYNMFQLDTLNDIDDLEDLVNFYKKSRSNSTSESVKVIFQNRKFIPGI